MKDPLVLARVDIDRAVNVVVRMLPSSHRSKSFAARLLVLRCDLVGLQDLASKIRAKYRLERNNRKKPQHPSSYVPSYQIPSAGRQNIPLDPLDLAVKLCI